MAKKKEKGKNRKKEKHLLGRKEFLFNFFSLVIIICIGMYFGYRGLYYYSKQNQKIKDESDTLNGRVIQNSPLAQGDADGFHRDGSGYFFRGMVNNNYVLFENRLFRIIRINSDNSVKLISDNLAASFPWGENSSYKKSNVYQWLEKSDEQYSGVYYNTLSAIDEYLVKTEYEESIYKGNKIHSTKKYQDYITTLTIADYALAKGKNSYLNNGKNYFVLGLSENKENFFVDEEGSLETCDILDGYGIRPVITLKANLKVQDGNGTFESPYVISQEKAKTFVDSYVQIGQDIWRVTSDSGDSLKMYLNGYINYSGKEFTRNYSITNSIFDPKDRNSLAYYLNTTYLRSLPYSDFLLDFNSYIGELSDDAGYGYTNIYNAEVTAKVSLLNIFDYVSNNDLFDYFYGNTTSQVGSMEYNIQATGVLEESDVRDVKHVVPVVSIAKNSIKRGQGTVNDPYVVE